MASYFEQYTPEHTQIDVLDNLYERGNSTIERTIAIAENDLPLRQGGMRSFPDKIYRYSNLPLSSTTMLGVRR